MRKKVLLLADNLNNGGAERQMVLLAKNIPETWDVFLWSMDEGPFLKDILEAKIKNHIRKRKFQYDITPFFDLAKLVSSYRPTIIHSWGWMSTLAAIPITKIFGIPLVNGIIRAGKPYYYRGRLSRFVSQQGDVVVSNSRAGLAGFEIAQSRGKVIYNGFDLSRIQEKDHPKQETGKSIIIMAARMAKEKDFDLFIKAARKLSVQEKRSCKFLAVGYGAERNRLINENTDLVSQDILAFSDSGIEAIPLIRSSTIGIMLTKTQYHEEGCSNTIMEYMACGLPVIATDSGGNKELIDDEVTGFIIPDGDIEQLVNKIIWLIENPDQAKEMGIKGKQKIYTFFSVERMVKDTLQLYSSLERQ